MYLNSTVVMIINFLNFASIHKARLTLSTVHKSFVRFILFYRPFPL